MPSSRRVREPEHPGEFKGDRKRVPAVTLVTQPPSIAKLKEEGRAM